jgi:hypothetical protein
MKFFVSKLEEKHTIFFGEADSFTILRQNIQPSKILRDLNLSSLMYDHVILAAAYFWQSKTVYSLIPQIEGLIQSGTILPAIRDSKQTRDTLDYFEKRLTETSNLVKSPIYNIKALSSEIAKPNQKPVPLYLDNIGTFLHIDTQSIEAIFRRLWLNDTSDQDKPNSLYNIVFLSLPQKDQEIVVKFLRSINPKRHFSRSLIASHILSLPFSSALKSALIQRASNLYLLSNAIACKSDLLTPSRIVGYQSKSGQNSLGSLRLSNMDIFMEVLNLCGLSPLTINSLSTEEILSIKYSEEFIVFQEIYKQLVVSAMDEEQNLVKEILQKLASKQQGEKIKKKMLRTIGYLEAISAAIFTNTLSSVLMNTPVSQAVLIGSGAGAAISHFLKKTEWLRKTPILDFVEFVTKREFRKRLYGALLK